LARSKALGLRICLWLMRPRISATESMSRVEPFGHAFDQRLHMVDAVAQQGRGRHHGIGADQQIFDHLLGRIDAGGGGQRSAAKSAAWHMSHAGISSP
jgi:hypothetical protein